MRSSPIFPTLPLTVALASSCLASSAGPSVAPGNEPSPRFKFSISIPDQLEALSARGSPWDNGGRPAEMTLENQSGEPVWVNESLNVNGARMLDNEVELHIVGAWGEVLFLCKVRRSSGGSYKLLGPGERITVERDLACYGDMFFSSWDVHSDRGVSRLESAPAAAGAGTAID